MLKAYGKNDILYPIVVFCAQNYGIYCQSQKVLFETGYPAHPYIIGERTKVINKCCFKNPEIIKNEIEYLHDKIHCGFTSDSTDEFL